MKYEGIRYEVITLKNIDDLPRCLTEAIKASQEGNLYYKGRTVDLWEKINDFQTLDSVDLELLGKGKYAIGIPDEPLIEFKTKKYRQYKSKFEFAANNQKFGPYLTTNDRDQLYIVTSVEDDEVELDGCIKQDYLSLQFGYKHFNAITGETHVCGVRV